MCCLHFNLLRVCCWPFTGLWPRRSEEEEEEEETLRAEKKVAAEKVSKWTAFIESTPATKTTKTSRDEQPLEAAAAAVAVAVSRPGRLKPERSRGAIGAPLNGGGERGGSVNNSGGNNNYYGPNLVGSLKPFEDLKDTIQGLKDCQSMSSEKTNIEQAKQPQQQPPPQQLQHPQQQGKHVQNNNNNNNDDDDVGQVRLTAQSDQVYNQAPAVFGSTSVASSYVGENVNQISTLEKSQSAPTFAIKTRQRRHLDFDGPYELADREAKNRSKWRGPFHFVQAADSQFGMIDSYVHKRTEPGWKEEIELCENLVNICNNMQPRPLFLVICGDLVDSLPVASGIGQKQVVDFKRIFAKLNGAIPLVCVCGNHDVGDQPTEQTVADYRQTFGDDYFFFTKNDVLFIVINSQFYQHREFVKETAREQDLWLEEILSKCKLFKYSIVFEHIPWFLEEPNEENDYFNIRKEVRLEWLRKFKDAGVTKIMCGHYHRNAGGWFEGMELVVTSAIGAQCGKDKSGVRIVRVLEESIEHQYYAMPDVPHKIELH